MKHHKRLTLSTVACFLYKNSKCSHEESSSLLLWYLSCLSLFIRRWRTYNQSIITVIKLSSIKVRSFWTCRWSCISQMKECTRPAASLCFMFLQNWTAPEIESTCGWLEFWETCVRCARESVDGVKKYWLMAWLLKNAFMPNYLNLSPCLRE